MEKEIIIIKTKDCNSCFCRSSCYDDFSVGEAWTHTCNIMYSRFLDEFERNKQSDIEFMLENDDNGQPIFPNWCPLKTNKILIEWEN